jgi:hypothetical protein
VGGVVKKEITKLGCEKYFFSDFQKRRADLNQRFYDSHQTHHPDLRAFFLSFFQYLWMVRLTLSITGLKMVITLGLCGHVSFSWKKMTLPFLLCCCTVTSHHGTLFF